jgi:hypothetical protein
MPTPRESVDVNEFRRVLSESRDERTAVEFLKSAPWVPYWTFCSTGGHDRYAIFEFPLGCAHKCDLLLLNSYSGYWEALFVEFEAVVDRVFTKAGVPSKRLAIAQRQVDDWNAYITQHREVVRADMVRYAKRKDRLKYSARTGEPSNFGGDRLSDPTTHINFKFKIVIGRSSSLSPEARQLAGRYLADRSAELVTYDRLLHLAERRYEGKHKGAAGECLPNAI